MTTKLITSKEPALVLVPDPDGVSKDQRYRLGKFAAWLKATNQDWHQPDLRAYRDHLKGRNMAPGTILAHLSTIRARYADLLRDRPRFFRIVEEGEPDLDFVTQKAKVDELITRIENAMDPKAARVQDTTHQDRPDSDHLRLTSDQASALMASPGVATLQGLRDTAAIALMLCTGIREAELAGLDVPDLRQTLNGELSLHVRQGKGRKARLIPYGELSWVLAIVGRWLALAGIEDGPVVRGLYRGGQRLRPGRLSVRAIEYIVGSYPVMVDGELRSARPHDLRRTYARRLYDSGSDPVAIKQNLGHKQLETTLGYIGELDAKRRRPKAIYRFDLATLANLPAKKRMEL